MRGRRLRWRPALAPREADVARAAEVIPMTLDLRLAVRTPSLNEWQRMHWRVRQRTIKQLVFCLMASKGGRVWPVPPDCPVRVIVTRSYRSQPLDEDNGMGGLKPLLDALKGKDERLPVTIAGRRTTLRTGLQWINDDSPAWCQIWFRQVQDAEPYTLVRLEALPDEERPTMPTRVSSLEALEAENAALRGTLERFADRKNWTLIDLNGDHAMAWAAPEQHGQPADEARAALVPSAAADLLAAVREAAGALEAIVKVAKGLHVEALEIAREPGDEATIERARAARARLTPWAP